MSPQKTTNQEEEYFAKQEALKLRKLVVKAKDEMAEEERKKLKELHWMRCPKCGMKLEEITLKNVQVDKCFACNGLYLDDGELEKIVGQERGFFDVMRKAFEVK
jgi:protein-arginine kinase activator protein McsA